MSTALSGLAVQGQGRCEAGSMRLLVTFHPEMRNVLDGWRKVPSSKDNATSNSEYFRHTGFCPLPSQTPL